MSAVVHLSEAHVRALLRRHFSFLTNDEPRMDRQRDGWLATYVLGEFNVVVDILEDTDALGVYVTHASRDTRSAWIPSSSSHTGHQWDEERLTRAFSEHADELQARIERHGDFDSFAREYMR